MKLLIFCIPAGVLLVAAMGFIGLRPWDRAEVSLLVKRVPSATPASEPVSRAGLVVEETPAKASDQEFQPQIEPPRQSLVAATRFSPRGDRSEASSESSFDDSQSADSAQNIPHLSSAVQGVSSGGNSQTAGPAILDPSTPGNSFTFQGNRVALESMQSTADGSATDLSLAVTPVNNSRNAANNSATVDPVKNGLNDPATSRSRGRGFTLEEERFRTKWGWAAFSEAQGAALQQ